MSSIPFEFRKYFDQDQAEFEPDLSAAAAPAAEPAAAEPEPTAEPQIEESEAPARAPGPPRESFAEQLAAAHGAGGVGFQRPGTPGAALFRTANFYRGRSTADPKAALTLRVGRGAPFSSRSAGGERDDEARAWRAARMAARLPF